MAQQNPLKMDEETKRAVLEVSALSGFAQNICKEVLEYLLISWAIKIADNPEKPTKLSIPYLGTVTVQYVDDKILPTGELDTEVSTSVELSPSFKRLIGDINDEGRTDLIPMLQKKIEQAVIVASSDVS